MTTLPRSATRSVVSTSSWCCGTTTVGAATLTSSSSVLCILTACCIWARVSSICARIWSDAMFIMAERSTSVFGTKKSIIFSMNGRVTVTSSGCTSTLTLVSTCAGWSCTTGSISSTTSRKWSSVARSGASRTISAYLLSAVYVSVTANWSIRSVSPTPFWRSARPADSFWKSARMMSAP